jgi:hypothetical protein
MHRRKFLRFMAMAGAATALPWAIDKKTYKLIMARRNRPVLLSVRNNLPADRMLPVDPTLPAGTGVTNGDVPDNRIATHLHGGFTPWISDGTPFQWFTPTGMKDTSGASDPTWATAVAAAYQGTGSL